MNLKKMDFFDKMIYGFGLALGGVVLFVLLAGVVIALLSLLLEGKIRGDNVQAIPEADESGAPLLGDRRNLLEGGDADVREIEEERALV